MVEYRIHIHDWASRDHVAVYTSAYVPNIGELIEVTVDSATVRGRVQDKAVRQAGEFNPVFFLYTT